MEVSLNYLISKTDSKRYKLSSKDDLDVAFIDEDPTKNTIVIVTDQSVDHSNQSSFSIRVNDTYYKNYEKVFNTFYMTSRIKTIATEKASDFTILEYLPQKHLDYLEQQETSLTSNCTCCLCRLRTKSTAAHEFCIKMHPFESLCVGDEDSKKTARLKYYPAQQSICDECIEVMTFKAKKIKGTRRFGCCFDSCDGTRLTKTTLKNHCFEHLDVKKFKCSVCDFSHDRKPAIRKHERNCRNKELL